MTKQEIIRGSRKRFQTTITDLDGNPQDPDAGTCYVRLEKVGGYDYDSPTQWYQCSNVGGTGVYGADVWLPESLTLGDWVARFTWKINGVDDYDSFEFTLVRKDKPWVHTRGPKGVPR